MDWFWPTVCAGCGAVGAARICVRCAAVGVHQPRVYVTGLEGAWTLAPYDSGLGHALREAKTRGDRALAQVCGHLVARRLAPYVSASAFQAIVPAPSTLSSRVRRGFSCAAVFAEAIASTSGLPVVHALVRRGGARQAQLDRTARRRNLKGRVRAEVCPPGRVLLVDDVVTTGATADACTRELLGAGATSVWLATACLARSTARGTRRKAS